MGYSRGVYRIYSVDCASELRPYEQQLDDV